VPACAQCHGPGGGPRNPHYPVLAGQYAHYLIQQLELFKNGQRGGSPYAHLMREVAPRLTSEQIREVAQYYASLPLETQ
jgi:cytochrome c553